MSACNPAPLGSSPPSTRINGGSRFWSSLVRKYFCTVCGYIYDEANGVPEEEIAPGTRFDDLPLNWCCPDCSARREDFELIAE
ncbi:MAG: rubredoxin [Gammaproteobacteria bacterium]|nr:rubredoxin [Gammaproteobacteria bacterium]